MSGTPGAHALPPPVLAAVMAAVQAYLDGEGPPGPTNGRPRRLNAWKTAPWRVMRATDALGIVGWRRFG